MAQSGSNPTGTPAPPPAPGDDQAKVLAAWGLAQEELARLRAAGVIGPFGG